MENVEPQLPARFGQVLLCDTETTNPIVGEASSPHGEWPYFFEVPQLSSDKGLSLIGAYVTAVRLASDVHLRLGPYAIEEGQSSHTIGPLQKVSRSSWGHYSDTLTVEAMQFAQRFGPRLSHLSLRPTYNRLSNALRLYESALDLIPSDVALVVFISVLEGLFSTATQDLAYRLGLAIAWYVGLTAEERLSVFKDVKELYTIRSKIVHGDRITADEEQAAVALAEYHVPRVEEIVRRAMRKIFEDGLDSFVETTKHLDTFYQLLALGIPLADALRSLGVTATRPTK